MPRNRTAAVLLSSLLLALTARQATALVFAWRYDQQPAPTGFVLTATVEGQTQPSTYRVLPSKPGAVTLADGTDTANLYCADVGPLPPGTYTFTVALEVNGVVGTPSDPLSCTLDAQGNCPKAPSAKGTCADDGQRPAPLPPPSPTTPADVSTPQASATSGAAGQPPAPAPHLPPPATPSADVPLPPAQPVAETPLLPAPKPTPGSTPTAQPVASVPPQTQPAAPAQQPATTLAPPAPSITSVRTAPQPQTPPTQTSPPTPTPAPTRPTPGAPSVPPSPVTTPPTTPVSLPAPSQTPQLPGPPPPPEPIPEPTEEPTGETDLATTLQGILDTYTAKQAHTLETYTKALDAATTLATPAQRNAARRTAWITAVQARWQQYAEVTQAFWQLVLAWMRQTGQNLMTAVSQPAPGGPTR